MDRLSDIAEAARLLAECDCEDEECAKRALANRLRSQPPMLDGPTVEAALLAIPCPLCVVDNPNISRGDVGSYCALLGNGRPVFCVARIRALSASSVQEGAKRREGMEQAESSGVLALSPQSPVVCKPWCGTRDWTTVLGKVYLPDGGPPRRGYCTEACLVAAAAPQGVPPDDCALCDNHGGFNAPCPRCDRPARSPQVEPATPRQRMEEEFEKQLPTLPKVFMCPEHKATIIDEEGTCVYCDAEAPLSPNPDYVAPAAPVESVRPARTAREVAHDILRIIDAADVWDFPCALEGKCVGMCDEITAIIAGRDRRGRTGDEPGAVELARDLLGRIAHDPGTAANCQGCRTAIAIANEGLGLLAGEAQKEPR